MTSENWVAPSDSPFWEVRDFEGKTFEELLAARQAQWQPKKKSRWEKKRLAESSASTELAKKDDYDECFPASNVLKMIARKRGFKELSPEEEQEVALMIMQVESLNAKLVTVVQDAALEALDPDRPPSPAPIYGADGSRVNTREVRLRNKLKFERDTIIKRILKLKPNYVTPADYVRERPKRKLYIPAKEYPNYNFIGLVIGPRGQTQKQMEKETGAKIVIRGRGSVKEGARGRDEAEQDDELHVLITAETEEQVEKAQKLVMPLLQPIDDSLNAHKQAQLQTLAKLNGTEKDSLQTHLWFNEQMSGKTYNANVRCAICGEPHATRDCPLKAASDAAGATAAGDSSGGTVPAANMDEEYLKFMSELGEGPAPGASGAVAPPPNITATPPASAPAAVAAAPSIDSAGTVAVPTAAAESTNAIAAVAQPLPPPPLPPAPPTSAPPPPPPPPQMQQPQVPPPPQYQQGYDQAAVAAYQQQYAAYSAAGYAQQQYQQQYGYAQQGYPYGYPPQPGYPGYQ